MRNAFASEITSLAKSDSRIALLSGDIGNRLFDDFKQNFPDRFYNCGVAEGNMIGVAAGMASSGVKPIVYTIASFNTYRCLEQIKIDVCYHELPVIIVGVGAGLSYCANGATHQSCEDIAILRVLPNMKVVCPADSREVKASIKSALEDGGPVYIRLGKKNEPHVHEQDPDFKIGRAIKLLPGDDVCVLATGTMVHVAKDMCQRLSTGGISAELYSFHTVKPLDERCLGDITQRFPLLVTIEEHSILGGLGSALAEYLAIQGPQETKLLSIGTPDMFLHSSGNQNYFRSCFGLDSQSIGKKIKESYCKLVGKDDAL